MLNEVEAQSSLPQRSQEPKTFSTATAADVSSRSDVPLGAGAHVRALVRLVQEAGLSGGIQDLEVGEVQSDLGVTVHLSLYGR